MRHETATITICNGAEAGTSVECAFNPSAYRMEKTATYDDLTAAGTGAPLTQFVDGGAETLSMELFFDTTDRAEPTDVRTAYVDHVDTLLSVDDDIGAPPVCRFVWGEGLDFTAVLERADKRFTKFRPSGVPVRARVDVTFREYRASEASPPDAAAATDTTRRRVLTEGERLSAVAAEAYDDPSAWRTIASHNDISNPRDVPAGTELEVPPR
ncbi:LysM peptidoglycan-binding domain-containing protein [Halapricum sp. CBA1109]|uniref:CIS tube protein n=1 Tax=Halapricum sp. CBA1109 TaxID=2668068 RepID=UPI0012FCCE01|nr:LysM peptidoglycan-binding domain-containing protein [Halapricum sp. CBA1109]MUV89626.1 LysM peptidoglycan-binding domain-containing protein [Halapricum sp. CBA1109]